MANAPWPRSRNPDAEENGLEQRTAVVVAAAAVAAARTGCGTGGVDLLNEVGSLASLPPNRVTEGFARYEALKAASQDASPFPEYVGLLLGYGRAC